jgi:hypothetical protein
MKKTLIFVSCLILSMSALGKTFSIKDVTRSLLSDDMSRDFIIQFKGSEAYESIKFKMYDDEVWEGMANSDDPLASYILLQHSLANGQIDRALDYAAITYVQTDQKEFPLQVIASLFSMKYESDIHTAAIYHLLVKSNEQVKTTSRYVQYLKKYKVAVLEDKSKKLLLWLKSKEREHGNYFVRYTKPEMERN